MQHLAPYSTTPQAPLHNARLPRPSTTAAAAEQPPATAALDAGDLARYGLALTPGSLLKAETVFERPAWLFGHRVKSCSIGAFTFFNAAGTTSVYRTRLGRYAQIGESSIIGPPEHPMDWFSNHPFAFTRPSHIPAMYEFADFARLAPADSDEPAWAESAPLTKIGHEAYIGAGCFIKRGVSIGDGAVIGARSVVTQDIPAYTIAVGSPARVIRDRFAPSLVERFLVLQWWRYDLAPHKAQLDFAEVEATLDTLEQLQSENKLKRLMPATYRVCEQQRCYRVEQLSRPLYD
nr:CatB-related O-acetyltransferase [Oceanococcus sp. HetDA_MAG_MS8]